MITLALATYERMGLVAYMASKIGVTPVQLVGSVPFEVAAVHHSGKLVGAVLYQDRRRHTVEMAVAGEPGWLTPGDVRRMWGIAFESPNCLTVIATVCDGNKKAQLLAEHMGAEVIGSIPNTYGQGKNGILYCMRREHCKWLPKNDALKFLSSG